MINKAIFAGTFDPMTKGHAALIGRAKLIFEEVVVAVAAETGKNAAPLSRRMEIAEASAPEVRIAGFNGLLTDFMRSESCRILVRGLRGPADFEYERQLESVYKRSMPELEVVYLTAEEGCGYISSTMVRALKSAGGDVSPYVCTKAKNLIERYY